MTGEQEQRDEPLEPDDTESAFILEDWDELDEVLAETEQDAARQARALAEGKVPANPAGDVAEPLLEPTEPEDLLFAAGPSGARDVPSRRAFDQHSAASWGGNEQRPEDIGIPIDPAAARAAELADLADREVQQVDFEPEPDQGEVGGDSGFFQATDQVGDSRSGVAAARGDSGERGDLGRGESFLGGSDEPPLSFESGTYPRPAAAGSGSGLRRATGGTQDTDFFAAAEDPAAGPAHEVSFQPEDEGADAVGDSGFFSATAASGRFPHASGIGGTGGEAESEQESWSADAEANAEPAELTEYDEPVQARPAWAPEPMFRPRRRARVSVVAGLVAVLLAGLGIGTLVLKPEWLGARPPSVAIQRTEVARPSVDLTPAALPEHLPAAPVEVAVEPDLPPVGGELPVEPTDPVVEVTPLPPNPVEPEPDPIAQGDPSEVEPASPPQPASPAGGERLAVGEHLEIGGEREVLAGPVPAAPGGRTTNLVAGDQAFALLHNGNYFVGAVKGVEEEDVTLRIEHGELTLGLADLRSLGSTQGPEFAALRRAAPGFLRLTNQNRLRGSIVKVDGDGIAVDVQQSRIVLPASEVDEITAEQPEGIRMTDEGDEEWVRRLVERRIEEKDQVQAKEQLQAKEQVQAEDKAQRAPAKK